jgi:hypothetical protein
MEHPLGTADDPPSDPERSGIESRWYQSSHDNRALADGGAMAVLAGDAISAVDSLPRRRIRVGDSEMSYVDTGGPGNPIEAIRLGRICGETSFPRLATSVGASRPT